MHIGGGRMSGRYRASLWTVSGVHLVAAGVTWFVGVPVATPFVLALAAVVAFALGLTGSQAPDDDGHPQLGRSAGHRGHAEDPAPDEQVVRTATAERRDRLGRVDGGR